MQIEKERKKGKAEKARSPLTGGRHRQTELSASSSPSSSVADVNELRFDHTIATAVSLNVIAFGGFVVALLPP